MCLEIIGESKMAARSFLKALIFLLLGGILFFLIQEVFIPDSKENGGEEQVIHGIYALPDDTLDALFLGSSHVYNGISPMAVYESTGIVSYSLATSAQPIECSFFLLQEVYERQHPKVVILDAAGLFSRDDENKFWRFVLDYLPLSRTKIEIAQLYDKYEFSDGFLSVLFPVIKYHSRWDALTAADFKSRGRGFYYSGGESIRSIVNRSPWTVEDVDHWTKELMQLNQGSISYLENGNRYNQIVDDPIYSPAISENGRTYLTKIHEMCRENGAQLVLMKVPTMSMPQYYPGVWTREKYQLTAALAKELQIPYIDFMYDIDPHIDFETETIDAGVHLNLRGAQKISQCLAGYIQKQFKLEGKSNPFYDDALKQYQRVAAVGFLQSENSLFDYLGCLTENKENWTILISACADYTNGISSEEYLPFQALSLNLFSKGESMDSYVAILDHGALVYEALSDRRIEYKTELNGLKVKLISAGWLNGQEASITIDEVQYANNMQGLNIVVYDKEKELVIDSVTFDTHQESKPCFRNNESIWKYLQAYESAVCFSKQIG